jgi:hypothetical protein
LKDLNGLETTETILIFCRFGPLAQREQIHCRTRNLFYFDYLRLSSFFQRFSQLAQIFLLFLTLVQRK